jgi:pimeloyl-ACP methyl ester carboxylesterase
MTRRRVLAPALLALLAALALVVPGGAQAAAPLRYTPLTPTALLASPPGSNDFACTPTAAHPRPVVLLHGLGATDSQNFSTLSPLLANNGYCVFSLTYGRQSALPPGFSSIGGLQALEDSGPSVAAFVDRVLAATGSA